MSKPSLWKRLASVSALCAVAAIASPAQTFTSLVSFNVTDGALPYYGPLAQGFDGNLYGTTASGPLSCFYDKGRAGCGTVFKLTTAGALTTIYNFSSAQWEPEAGLVLGTDGSFYGTTFLGGDLSQSNCIDDLGNNVGCGTVFKINSQGKLTTLHNFDYTDGANPESELLLAADGNFYGVAFNGGPNFYGTIFKITPGGNLTILHSFDFTDGAYPSALVEDSNGNFYGTTSSGGAYSQGTVFKLAPDGTLTTLYSFCPQSGCADGSSPQNGLVQAADGNFYGTADGGTGTFCTGGGCGTVFKITPAGALTTLYNFCSLNKCADGNFPTARLAVGTDGNFYGTTSYGGSGAGCSSNSVCGTVFKITPGGVLTTLHSFDVTDGSDSVGRLLQATDGNFYGTTANGGTYSAGTAFRVSVGLSPFVKPVPTSGKVGSTVVILGTDLKGATSVTFNGTAAEFTVTSNSAITTTVPTGATTGKIEVTTPSGILTSNVKFRVR